MNKSCVLVLIVVVAVAVLVVVLVVVAVVVVFVVVIVVVAVLVGDAIRKKMKKVKMFLTMNLLRAIENKTRRKDIGRQLEKKGMRPQ